VAFAFKRSKNSGCVIKDYSAEPQRHHKQVRNRYPRRIPAASTLMLTRGVEFAAHLWRTSFAKDQFWREFAEFLGDGMSVVRWFLFTFNSSCRKL
jgi:hypothetical protein